MKPIERIAAALAMAVLVVNAAPAGADTRTGKLAMDRLDYDKALAELRPEAKKGDADAMYYVGRMYQAGWGVKKDLSTAMEWFEKAAKADQVDAQKEYGAALALGDGVEQDMQRGLKWLMIAAERGHDGARAYVTNLTKHIPKSTILESRRAAYEWTHNEKDKTGLNQ